MLHMKEAPKNNQDKEDIKKLEKTLPPFCHVPLISDVIGCSWVAFG